jgi:cell division protein FtsZ
MMAKSDPTAAASTLHLPDRVLMVGVGGMGINALQQYAASGDRYPAMLAVDTDGASLQRGGLRDQVQLAPHLAQGLSTGGSVQMARRCAHADVVELRERLIHQQQLVLFAGLGGGVGSGAAPVIAETARDEGALVLSIVTMPFSFEGEERKRQADEALRTLRAASHAVIVMHNDDWLAGDAVGLSLTAAFRQANQQLGDGLRVLWHLLAEPTLINLDVQSVFRMLEGGDGDCAFLYVRASGGDKVQTALASVREHAAVRERRALEEARGILVGLIGGPDLTLADVHVLVREVTADVPAEARRFMGAGIDDALRDQLSVCLLVAGSAAAQQGAAAVDETATKPKPKRRLVAPVDSRKVNKPVPPQQGELVLDPVPAKGRFKDVEPTLYEGEDLDMPTFIRRGMRLSR